MDELVAALNKIAQDAELASSSLEEAVYAKKEVETAIRDVKVALAASRTSEAVSAYDTALTAAKEAAPVLYKKNVRLAVATAPEYAFDSFLAPLLSIGDDEDLYSITKTGAGWASSISVNLNMDSVAGDIDDYARGVDAMRDILGIKEGRDPDKASMIWRTKIYGKGPYYKTVKGRIAESGAKAPFWSLLNDGTKNVNMSSDTGGSAYPSNRGTRFVHKAEEEIKSYFLVNFQLAKIRYDRGVEYIEDAIAEATGTLNSLQSEIDRMARDSEILNQIAREIGVTVDELSASKIIQAARKIRNGEPIAAQVRVGATGDKRIRARKFAELAYGFGE